MLFAKRLLYMGKSSFCLAAGGASGNYHAEPTPVQDSWLVSQQAEGHQRWQVLTGMENWTELEFNLQGFYRRVSFDVVICVLDPCQQSWEQAPWWFGKVKEDPCSSWAPSLLGVCFDLSFVDINMTIAHRGSSGTNTTQSSIGHFRYLKIPTWLVGGIKQKKSQRGWGMNN